MPSNNIWCWQRFHENTSFVSQELLGGTDSDSEDRKRCEVETFGQTNRLDLQNMRSRPTVLAKITKYGICNCVNACRPYNPAVASTYRQRRLKEAIYLNCSSFWRWWLPGREVLHHTWPAATCSSNTTAKGKVTSCAWEGVAGRRSIGCQSRYSAVTSSGDVTDWGRAIQNNCNAAAVLAGRVRHCVPAVGWSGWKPVTKINENIRRGNPCFLTGDGNE